MDVDEDDDIWGPSELPETSFAASVWDDGEDLLNEEIDADPFSASVSAAATPQPHRSKPPQPDYSPTASSLGFFQSVAAPRADIDAEIGGGGGASDTGDIWGFDEDVDVAQQPNAPAASAWDDDDPLPSGGHHPGAPSHSGFASQSHHSQPQSPAAPTHNSPAPSRTPGVPAPVLVRHASSTTKKGKARRSLLRAADEDEDPNPAGFQQEHQPQPHQPQPEVFASDWGFEEEHEAEPDVSRLPSQLQPQAVSAADDAGWGDDFMDDIEVEQPGQLQLQQPITVAEKDGDDPFAQAQQDEQQQQPALPAAGLQFHSADQDQVGDDDDPWGLREPQLGDDGLTAEPAQPESGAWAAADEFGLAPEPEVETGADADPDADAEDDPFDVAVDEDVATFPAPGDGHYGLPTEEELPPPTPELGDHVDTTLPHQDEAVPQPLSSSPAVAAEALSVAATPDDLGLDDDDDLEDHNSALAGFQALEALVAEHAPWPATASQSPVAAADLEETWPDSGDEDDIGAASPPAAQAFEVPASPRPAAMVSSAVAQDSASETMGVDEAPGLGRLPEEPQQNPPAWRSAFFTPEDPGRGDKDPAGTVADEQQVNAAEAQEQEERDQVEEEGDEEDDPWGQRVGDTDGDADVIEDHAWSFRPASRPAVVEAEAEVGAAQDAWTAGFPEAPTEPQSDLDDELGSHSHGSEFMEEGPSLFADGDEEEAFESSQLNPEAGSQQPFALREAVEAEEPSPEASEDHPGLEEPLHEPSELLPVTDHTDTELQPILASADSGHYLEEVLPPQTDSHLAPDPPSVPGSPGLAPAPAEAMDFRPPPSPPRAAPEALSFSAEEPPRREAKQPEAEEPRPLGPSVLVQDHLETLEAPAGVPQSEQAGLGTSDNADSDPEPVDNHPLVAALAVRQQLELRARRLQHQVFSEALQAAQASASAAHRSEESLRKLQDAARVLGEWLDQVGIPSPQGQRSGDHAAAAEEEEEELLVHQLPRFGMLLKRLLHAEQDRDRLQQELQEERLRQQAQPQPQQALVVAEAAEAPARAPSDSLAFQQQMEELSQREALVAAREQKLEAAQQQLGERVGTLQQRTQDLKQLRETLREQEAQLGAREEAVRLQESQLEALATDAELRRQAEEQESAARLRQLAEGEEALRAAQQDLLARQQGLEGLRVQLQQQAEANAAAQEELTAREEALASRQSALQERVARQKDQLQASTEQLVALRDRLRDRAAELDAQEQSLEAARAQLEVDLAQLAAREANLDQVQAQGMAGQAEAKRLRASVEAQEAELSRLRQQLEHDRDQLEQSQALLEQGWAELEQERASCHSEIEEYRAQVHRQLEETQQALWSRSAEVKAQLRARAEELSAQEVELEEQRALWEQARDTQLRELQAEREALQELRDRASELEAQRAEFQLQFSQLETDRAALEAEREEFVEERQAQFAKLKDSQERLAERVGVLQQRHQQLVERKAELDSREAGLDGREAELGSREAQLDSREAQLDGRESALESRDAELREREEALEARAAAVPSEESLAELQSVVAQRVQLKQDQEALQNLRETLRQDQEALQKEREALLEGQAALQARSQELDESISEQEAVAERLADKERQLHNAQETLESFRTTLGQRSEHLGKQEQQLEEREQLLEEREADLLRRKDVLQQQVDMFREKVQALKERAAELDRQQEELDARSQDPQADRAEAVAAQARPEDVQRLQQLEDQVALLETQLAAAQDGEQRLRQELESVQSERSELARELETVSRSRAEEEDGLAARLEELDARKRQMDAREADLESFRTSLGERAQALTDRELELEQLEETLEARAAEIDAQQTEVLRQKDLLQQQVDMFREKVQALKERAADLDRRQEDFEAAQLQKDTAAADAASEVEDLRQQLATQEADLAQRQLAQQEVERQLEAVQARCAELESLLTSEQRELDSQNGGLVEQLERLRAEHGRTAQLLQDTMVRSRSLEQQLQQRTQLLDEALRTSADRDGIVGRPDGSSVSLDGSSEASDLEESRAGGMVNTTNDGDTETDADSSEAELEESVSAALAEAGLLDSQAEMDQRQELCEARAMALRRAEDRLDQQEAELFERRDRLAVLEEELRERLGAIREETVRLDELEASRAAGTGEQEGAVDEDGAEPPSAAADVEQPKPPGLEDDLADPWGDGVVPEAQAESPVSPSAGPGVDDADLRAREEALAEAERSLERRVEQLQLQMQHLDARQAELDERQQRMERREAQLRRIEEELRETGEFPKHASVLDAVDREEVERLQHRYEQAVQHIKQLDLMSEDTEHELRLAKEQLQQSQAQCRSLAAAVSSLRSQQSQPALSPGASDRASNDDAKQTSDFEASGARDQLQQKLEQQTAQVERLQTQLAEREVQLLEMQRRLRDLETQLLRRQAAAAILGKHAGHASVNHTAAAATEDDSEHEADQEAAEDEDVLAAESGDQAEFYDSALGSEHSRHMAELAQWMDEELQLN